MAIFAQRTVMLNLSPGSVPPVLYVSQYDSGYQINFRIYNGSTPFDIPDDVNVRFDMTKVDGHGVSNSITKNTSVKSFCHLWMTEQMTAVAGDQICEIVLVHRDDNRRIGTANFIMRVEKAALRDDAIMSDSQINYVQQKINQWSGLAAYGDALDTAQTDIESLKTGKAPTNHASTDNKYGVGTQYSFGHLKLWLNSTTLPPNGVEYAAEAMMTVGFIQSMRPVPYTPTDGWTWGGSFDSAASAIYCRRMWNMVQITFSARVKSDATIPKATNRNIVTNLPGAMMRTYVPAFAITYDGDSKPVSITPVMCAIRPEESASNSAYILKIDAGTNPTALASGTLIFGSFCYVSNDWG